MKNQVQNNIYIDEYAQYDDCDFRITRTSKGVKTFHRKSLTVKGVSLPIDEIITFEGDLYYFIKLSMITQKEFYNSIYRDSSPVYLIEKALERKYKHFFFIINNNATKLKIVSKGSEGTRFMKDIDSSNGFDGGRKIKASI